MPIEMVLWPEEIIRLNEELSNGLHQELEKRLEGMPSADFIERFATIAAYCEVALDGRYDSNQILEIAKILLKRLIELRKRPDNGRPEIILPFH